MLSRSIAHNVQRALASVGVVAHRRSHVRFGHDALLDIERLLGQPSVILDVGANEGQSALPFAEAFPHAAIFSFEPVPQTFATLCARTRHEPRIACFNVALGAEEGKTRIRLSGSSGHNSLLRTSEPGPGTAAVRVTTGDRWAADHGIGHVDVLKIDTEGYELRVLDGCEGLLAANRVSSVLAECEFDRVTAEPHTSFFALYDYLTGRGMSFVTLYTDALASGRFAWGNALFIRTGSGAALDGPTNGAGGPRT